MKFHNGSIVTLVLVFGAIFSLMFSGLFGFILVQHKNSIRKVAYAEALEIAEAGINYYRWHLAHSPEDLQDGTGSPGPYEHEYYDPEGGLLGKFQLSVEGSQQCGLVGGISISSTGWTEQFPNTKRTVKAKYVRPTVADFAHLLNANVWAGADREIKGPYHSNGGVKMDGENNSLVTSAQETWLCTESFGCDPPENKPGVFGSGENSDLWRFPVPVFDFNGITMDLATMKSLAQGGSGLYFAPSGDEGYHVILKADRSMDVYRVTSLDSVYAYDSENGWHWEESVIGAEVFLGNYAIPADCGLIFMEDNLWVGKVGEDSKINGKISLISADLIDSGKQTDIWIVGNVDYVTGSDSDGFFLLAQRNNLISLYVPDQMGLEGVYMAQTGRFGRNHYPNWYSPYHKRAKLEMQGTVVSDGRVGTKWSCSGIYCSGFSKRENTYDPQLSAEPPPFLPTTSEEHEFKEWEEVQ